MVRIVIHRRLGVGQRGGAAEARQVGDENTRPLAYTMHLIQPYIVIEGEPVTDEQLIALAVDSQPVVAASVIVRV